MSARKTFSLKKFSKTGKVGLRGARYLLMTVTFFRASIAVLTWDVQTRHNVELDGARQ
jgi:hypothetical protein